MVLLIIIASNQICLAIHFFASSGPNRWTFFFESKNLRYTFSPAVHFCVLVINQRSITTGTSRPDQFNGIQRILREINTLIQVDYFPYGFGPEYIPGRTTIRALYVSRHCLSLSEPPSFFRFFFYFFFYFFPGSATMAFKIFSLGGNKDNGNRTTTPISKQLFSNSSVLHLLIFNPQPSLQ